MCPCAPLRVHVVRKTIVRILVSDLPRDLFRLHEEHAGQPFCQGMIALQEVAHSGLIGCMALIGYTYVLINNP